MILTIKEIKTLFSDNTLKLDDKTCPTGISKDTRILKPGEIYVALSGENFDGHDYVAKALKQGAIAAIVSDKKISGDNIIYVEDTIKALGKLAHYYRQKFSQPLVAITGSNGKTTTKEFLTHVLKTSGSVIATQGNLNNHIGVPLTIFSFHENADFFVVEMGMNHLDEIAYLTQITQPTEALITNVGRAHLEGVGGKIEHVTQAKSELFTGLDEQNTAFYYTGCPYISAMQTKAQKRTFGFSPNNDVWAENIIVAQQGTTFSLHYENKSLTIKLSLVGKHHVQNALAVFSICHKLGLHDDLIKQGLESFTIKLNRGRKIVKNSVTFIDDTYNANPDSVLTAFNALLDEYPQAYTIVALGSMLELGDNSPQWHEEIGKKAKDLGFNEIFAYGNLAQNYLKGFGYAQSMCEKRFFQDHNNMADAIKESIDKQKEPVVVLFKGSRGMTMEKVLANLEKTIED
jgi:UDP-N-acetylmuramoyl-tripeptide--D-alanyl-D-alanine ligase